MYSMPPGRFFTLKQMTDKAGLTETLVTGGPFTVFAPTNEGFAKLNLKTDDDTPVDVIKKANMNELILKITFLYFLFPYTVTIY